MAGSRTVVIVISTSRRGEDMWVCYPRMRETLLVLGDAAKVLTMRAKMKAIDLMVNVRPSVEAGREVHV